MPQAHGPIPIHSPPNCLLHLVLTLRHKPGLPWLLWRMPFL